MTKKADNNVPAIIIPPEPPKSPPKKIPEESREDIYELILQGITYREIAERFDTTLMVLFNYLYTDPKHYTRTKQCLEYSAHLLVEQAEQVLLQAKDNPSLLYVAGLFAHHYRWKASLLNKRAYNNSEKANEMSGVKKEITIKVIRDE